MSNIKRRFRLFYDTLVKTMRNPVMQILPGQIAFFFLLSSLPIILIFGVVAPIFSISIDSLTNFIVLSLPANTSKLVLPLIQGKGFDINVIILIISALYLASRGTKSIIIASSTIYGVRKNSAIKNIIKSIIITILLVLLFVFIAFVSVFGGRILNLISYIDGFTPIIDSIITTYNMIRWPITVFVIFFVVKLVYTISPNKTIKSKSVNNGAAFTTILWAIATAIYSYYITHFSSYNIFYGSAANIIILLLWIYIISYIFVFGMVINVTNKKLQDDTVNQKRGSSRR